MPEKIRDSAILNLAAGAAEGMTEFRRQEALLKTGALQNAILNSANFSIIATDEKGIIQLFNIGADHSVRKQVEAERKAPSGWAVCSGSN